MAEKEMTLAKLRKMLREMRADAHKEFMKKADEPSKKVVKVDRCYVDVDCPRDYWEGYRDAIQDVLGIIASK